MTVNSFSDLIHNTNFEQQIETAIREVVDAVVETAKMGEVKISLKIGNNGVGKLKIRPKVESKTPQLEAKSFEAFYEEGAEFGTGISLHHPNQVDTSKAISINDRLPGVKNGRKN